MTVKYICDNGHKHKKHKSQPDSHGMKPVCVDCSADIVDRVVPIYVCDDCGNRWGYTGNADNPTCSNCRGKRTEPVAGT